jgi:nicotinamide riboside kinase
LTEQLPLVVNIFGAPGSGKSTLAAGIYSTLRANGISAELVAERAKELAYDSRNAELDFQPVVIAQQAWRVHRLHDQVDVIVTDSPILNALIYKGDGYTESLGRWCVEMFHSYRSLSLLARRHWAYEQVGRRETRAQAEVIASQIDRLLADYEIPCKRVETIEQASRLVFEALHGTRSEHG